MKSAILVFLLLGFARLLRAEDSLTSVNFNLSIDGANYNCQTMILAKAGQPESFGPIFVMPVALASACTMGTTGAQISTKEGSAVVEPTGEHWFIKYKDLCVPARPGRLYALVKELDHFVLRETAFTVKPGGPKGEIDQVIAAGVRAL